MFSWKCKFNLTLHQDLRRAETQVDLAGSERVHRAQVGGQTLVEAKNINVSLFFLEVVIVGLRERGTKGRYMLCSVARYRCRGTRCALYAQRLTVHSLRCLRSVYVGLYRYRMK